jgi:hypothetical protein
MLCRRLWATKSNSIDMLKQPKPLIWALSAAFMVVVLLVFRHNRQRWQPLRPSLDHFSMLDDINNATLGVSDELSWPVVKTAEASYHID